MTTDHTTSEILNFEKKIVSLQNYRKKRYLKKPTVTSNKDYSSFQRHHVKIKHSLLKLAWTDKVQMNVKTAFQGTTYKLPSYLKKRKTKAFNQIQNDKGQGTTYKLLSYLWKKTFNQIQEDKSIEKIFCKTN